MPEVISAPRSNKKVELKMGNGNEMLITNLGTVWKLLRPFWCPHPHASLFTITGLSVGTLNLLSQDSSVGTLNLLSQDSIVGTFILLSQDSSVGTLSLLYQDSSFRKFILLSQD